jgi:hypothetical protein
MRRNTANAYTFLSARVSAAEKDEFRNLLPISGAQTACISIALEKLLTLAEASTEIQAFIHKDIQKHLHEETRGDPTEEISVRVGTDLYTRFNEIIPEQGGASWFIRRCLRALNAQLSTFVLDERIELAVRSILRGDNGTESSQ